MAPPILFQLPPLERRLVSNRRTRVLVYYEVEAPLVTPRFVAPFKPLPLVTTSCVASENQKAQPAGRLLEGWGSAVHGPRLHRLGHCQSFHRNSLQWEDDEGGRYREGLFSRLRVRHAKFFDGFFEMIFTIGFGQVDDHF